MNEEITKRLHISGLTSHISRDDLVKRFSSFGIVKALDGLGKLDANGDLRPYAYVTIESTKGQLAKCEPPPSFIISFSFALVIVFTTDT